MWVTLCFSVLKMKWCGNDITVTVTNMTINAIIEWLKCVEPVQFSFDTFLLSFSLTFESVRWIFLPIYSQ